MENPFIRLQMALGEEALEKLRNSHVAVFGIGGVGSYTAEALARAGVGAITLVDNDTVGVSNLNRQLCALHSTLRNNDMSAWENELIEAAELVVENTKYVKSDLTLSSNS